MVPFESCYIIFLPVIDQRFNKKFSSLNMKMKTSILIENCRAIYAAIGMDGTGH